MSAPLYGLLAEFTTADALIAAAKSVRAAGYTIEAYSPFPLEELDPLVDMAHTRVPLITLLGGIAGGAGTYFLQWYSAVIDYPIDVGGRPLHSWPSFIPATFEFAILGAALAAVFGMLLLNGLPRLHHPLFEVEQFDLASRNRFYLCLPASKAGFEPARALVLLAQCRPLVVLEVPA